MIDETLRNIVDGADLEDGEDVSLRLSIVAALREWGRFPAYCDDDRATTALESRGRAASDTGLAR